MTQGSGVSAGLAFDLGMIAISIYSAITMSMVMLGPIGGKWSILSLWMRVQTFTLW